MTKQKIQISPLSTWKQMEMWADTQCELAIKNGIDVYVPRVNYRFLLDGWLDHYTDERVDDFAEGIDYQHHLVEALRISFDSDSTGDLQSLQRYLYLHFLSDNRMYLSFCWIDLHGHSNVCIFVVSAKVSLLEERWGHFYDYFFDASVDIDALHRNFPAECMWSTIENNGKVLSTLDNSLHTVLNKSLQSERVSEIEAIDDNLDFVCK